MKGIKKEMLKIYVPYSNLDWLNYKLVEKEITFHHLKKKEDGGKAEIRNGALLMPIAHQYLHLIEYWDIETYITINNILKYVNFQRYEPTTEQRCMLEYLLCEFERKHKNDKTKKGKDLILFKYLDRGL